MPLYQVSETHYFRENGRRLDPGQTIELTEEQAAERNREHPGLLRPVPLNTQGRPKMVRTEDAPEAPEKPPRKKRMRRAR